MCQSATQHVKPLKFLKQARVARIIPLTVSIESRMHFNKPYAFINITDEQQSNKKTKLVHASQAPANPLVPNPINPLVLDPTNPTVSISTTSAHPTVIPQVPASASADDSGTTCVVTVATPPPDAASFPHYIHIQIPATSASEIKTAVPELTKKQKRADHFSAIKQQDRASARSTVCTEAVTEVDGHSASL